MLRGTRRPMYGTGSPINFAQLPVTCTAIAAMGHLSMFPKHSESPREKGKGLGVIATDINNDGWIDLFQANDMVSNFLFANRGGKRFDERAIEAGVAYSADGQVRSGMGVDAADVNDDGLQDLFVANIDHQTFSLYRNDGDELFTDISPQNSIARETRLLSGWGSHFFDVDNDGVLDLVLANGHPDDKVGSAVGECQL